jgi:hypothetical protein
MRAVATGLLAIGLHVAASSATAQPMPLELRFASETVPPGGVLQAKLEVTEPRPITTGGGSFRYGGFDEFLGLATHSPAGDAAAVAVVRGSSATVAMVSPSGGIGLDSDYPILTTTVRVPVGIPLGTQMPLTMSGQALFLDPSGAPYPASFRSGVVTIGAGPSIANVTPGSRLVPAGGVVVVEGVGFDADAELRINEVTLAETRVVSSTRIEAVLAQAATMHGRRIEVRNRQSDARTVYFAYQRTTPLGRSAHPLFGAVEPAFAQRVYAQAVVGFASGAVSSTLGLALQNAEVAPAGFVLQLYSGGTRLAQVSGAMNAESRVVRGLDEIFGVTCGGDCVVRLAAAGPLQAMGLTGDASRDLVIPVLPVPDTPPQLSTSVNASTLSPGQTLALSVSFTPGGLPVTADAYVVLQLPSGGRLSLTPAGLVPGVVPFVRAVSPPAALTLEVLRIVLPAGTPPGGYTWLSAMTGPGTLDLLTPLASTAFTITP